VTVSIDVAPFASNRPMKSPVAANLKFTWSAPFSRMLVREELRETTAFEKSAADARFLRLARRVCEWSPLRATGRKSGFTIRTNHRRNSAAIHSLMRNVSGEPRADT
jgi:hypothetical protein